MRTSTTRPQDLYKVHEVGPHGCSHVPCLREQLSRKIQNFVFAKSRPPRLVEASRPGTFMRTLGGLTRRTFGALHNDTKSEMPTKKPHQAKSVDWTITTQTNSRYFHRESTTRAMLIRTTQDIILSTKAPDHRARCFSSRCTTSWQRLTN